LRAVSLYSGRGLELAFGEIYLLTAASAGVFSVEFVRKYLGLSAAFGTIAGKRAEMFHLLESGAVFGFV
jgi:hypothetical protein